MHDYYIIAIASYLLGSVPFGLIVTKFGAGIDVRKHGSGNIGATNVLRASGKKFAALTLLLDGLKGIVAIHLAQEMYGNESMVVYLSAIMSILGHLFPVWLKFKGGKGVATSGFILIYLEPFLGLAVISTWLLVYKISRISSLSAIIAATMSPVYAALLFSSHEGLAIFCFTVSTLVLIKHTGNFKRLLAGTEKPIK